MQGVTSSLLFLLLLITSTFARPPPPLAKTFSDGFSIEVEGLGVFTSDSPAVSVKENRLYGNLKDSFGDVIGSWSADFIAYYGFKLSLELGEKNYNYPEITLVPAKGKMWEGIGRGMTEEGCPLSLSVTGNKIYTGVLVSPIAKEEEVVKEVEDEEIEGGMKTITTMEKKCVTNAMSFTIKPAETKVELPGMILALVPVALFIVEILFLR